MYTSVIRVGFLAVFLLVVSVQGRPRAPKCRNGAFFPNMDTCTGYYRCEHGRMTAKQCAPETVWSQRRRTCVHPADKDAFCKPEKKTTTTTTTTTTTMPPPQPPYQPTTPLIDIDESSFLDDDVLPVCSYDDEYIAISNCSGYYYQCSNGVPYKMSCPDNTVWSQFDQSCDDRDSTNMYIDCQTEPVFKCTNGAFFPNPDNCAGYYRCEHGKLTAMDCALETVWSQTLLTCVHPEDSDAYCNHGDRTTVEPGQTTAPDGETPAVTPACKCTHGDFIPKSNCLGHYRCVWGDLVEMPDCPVGQVWTQTHKTCVRIGGQFDDCVQYVTAAEYQSECQTSTPRTESDPTPAPSIVPDYTTVAEQRTTTTAQPHRTDPDDTTDGDDDGSSDDSRDDSSSDSSNASSDDSDSKSSSDDSSDVKSSDSDDSSDDKSRGSHHRNKKHRPGHGRGWRG